MIHEDFIDTVLSIASTVPDVLTISLPTYQIAFYTHMSTIQIIVMQKGFRPCMVMTNKPDGSHTMFCTFRNHEFYTVEETLMYNGKVLADVAIIEPDVRLIGDVLQYTMDNYEKITFTLIPEYSTVPLNEMFIKIMEELAGEFYAMP